MTKFGVFKRYWGDVGTKVDSIVKRRGARAYIPALVHYEDKGDACYKLSFDAPAFFYNAPQKGSSTKTGQSHRQGIFIDGTFTVSEAGGTTVLVNASCNLAIYDTEDITGESYTLRLIDSMHFDMENGETQSEFHPMFHVQRGHSVLITPDKIVSKVAEVTRLSSDKVRIVNDGSSMGSGYVRLPTPQMDYLSVLATVVADFFCSEGQSDRSTKDEFRALLKLLLGVRNIMRDGKPSQVLRKRWKNDEPPFSACHWYAESVN